VLTAVTALVDWFYYASSGEWRFANEAVIVLAVWVLLFFAYRWHVLRKQELAGSFSEERYKAHPIGYFGGPFKPQILWFGSAVLTIVIWDFCRVFLPLLRR
jgi:hypothetical protein